MIVLSLCLHMDGYYYEVIKSELSLSFSKPS